MSESDAPDAETGHTPRMRHDDGMSTETSSELYIDGPVSESQWSAGVWARPDHVARLLGVDTRTIRRRVSAGHYLRELVSGRVYIRATPRTEPLDTDDEEQTDAQAGHSDALSIILVEQSRRLESTMSALVEAKVDLGITRAELAHSESSRTAMSHELDLARASLTRAQHRSDLLERLALAPWYRMKMRRRLRRELAAVG